MSEVRFRLLRTGLAALCVVLLLGIGSANGADEPQLPPEACVRMLRSARIAHLRGDTAVELETLRAAAQQFPDEIAPLYALLEANRAHPLADDELARFRGILIARLEDPAGELPVGALQGIRANVEDEDILRKTTLHIERRLETGPTNASDLLHVLASIQNDLADKAAAAVSWARLLELEPSEIVAWDLYRTYAELERWEEASETFEFLLGRYGGELDEQLRPIYAQLLARAGRMEELFRQVDLHAFEGGTGPRNAVWRQVLTDMAWDLRDVEQDGEAKALFERALELEPDNVRVRARLVYLYGTEAERAQLAAAENERWGEEVDPRMLFDEGTKKLASGDVAAAVELLSRAAPELPDLEAAWYNLGMAAFRIEDWATASAAFARSSELNPERAESFFFRGMALYQLTRCGDAVPSLEQALTLDDGRRQAHYYLASCYRTLGDDDAAARHSRLYAESIEE